MKMKPATKRGIVLWLIVLAIFAMASGVGRAKGSEIVLNVANQFHEARCEKWREENNIPKQIEEYKAWLWLDPDNIPRSAKLVELHLINNEIFEAYNRVSPLVEKMDADDYTLCRLMTQIRTAQHNPEALEWGQRMLAVASDGQKAEARKIMKNTQQTSNTAVKVSP